jgi:hypothetical protein
MAPPNEAHVLDVSYFTGQFYASLLASLFLSGEDPRLFGLRDWASIFFVAFDRFCSRFVSLSQCFTICIQSFYTDRDAGRRMRPGDRKPA